VTVVHVVVPDGIDDPARPSGGNVYDRRVCRHLTEVGWSVHEHPVPVGSHAGLGEVVRRLPDDAVVLLDGLVASTAPDVLLPQASRLRLVMLVHMPLGRAAEGAVLSSAAAVVTTSAWARRELLAAYRLPGDHVHVAEPGVDPAGLVPETDAAGALLCVAAVIPEKGHEVLVDALAAATDLCWDCVCVGSLERDPAFVDGLRRRVSDRGLDGRLTFPGPRTGDDLDRSYAAANVLVLPSHAETYGMVITEALARGLPVVAADVGGVTEALGSGSDGIRPGLLVPTGDPDALAAALRAWLCDAELRRRLRTVARERRESLSGWSTTASVVAGVLAGVLP
jgi:glycosyltransferase involved in cell wall biosynthesis